MIFSKLIFFIFFSQTHFKSLFDTFEIFIKTKRFFKYDISNTKKSEAVAELFYLVF